MASKLYAVMSAKGPVLVALAIVAAVLALGPAKAQPVTWYVDILDTGYRPREITIDRGDTIVWQNFGTRVHSSTSDSCPQACVWDSGPIQPGGAFSHLFDVAHAIYGYHSVFDTGPAFQGYVTVQFRSPTPTPTPSATPTPTSSPLGSPTPSPTPSGSPGPTPTPGDLCYPEGEIAIAIPVVGLYIWIDGVWQESNGRAGLQRGEYRCPPPGNLIIPPDTHLLP